MLGAEAVEAFEQRGVGDGSAAVDGGHVDVVFGDGDSLLFEPCEIALCADGAGHDPEGVAGLADVGFEEEFAQVLEAGEALDGLRLQAVPDEDHVGGVGDGEVGVEQGFAVVEVVVEVFERGGGGDDEKAAVAHEVDGGLGGAVEEVDAEDAVGGCTVVPASCCGYFFIAASEIGGLAALVNEKPILRQLTGQRENQSTMASASSFASSTAF